MRPREQSKKTRKPRAQTREQEKNGWRLHSQQYDMPDPDTTDDLWCEAWTATFVYASSVTRGRCKGKTATIEASENECDNGRLQDGTGRQVDVSGIIRGVFSS